MWVEAGIAEAVRSRLDLGWGVVCCRSRAETVPPQRARQSISQSELLKSNLL